MDIRTTAAAVGRAMVGGRSSSRGREAGAALWSKVGSGDSLEDLLSGKAPTSSSIFSFLRALPVSLSLSLSPSRSHLAAVQSPCEAVPGKSRLTGYAATTTGAGMDFDEEACASLSEFTT